MKSTECRELEARCRGPPAEEETQERGEPLGVSVSAQTRLPRAPREHPSVHVPAPPLTASLVSFLHHTESLNDVFVLLCLTDAPTKPH